MSWATQYIAQLQQGKQVQFRPKGNSMEGLISSGDLVTVVPRYRTPRKGDIVLCKVKGKQYLHLIKATGPGERYMIGNNRGKLNGWTPLSQIYGFCTKVEK